MGKIFHIPVLAEKINTYLRPKEGMVMVDCTVVGGGHAADILKNIGGGGLLIGIDRDRQALGEARSRLEAISDRFELLNANFKDIDAILKEIDVAKIDGALFDLGISSLQMDNADRGFSLKLDGPLDMRMGDDSTAKASDIVNGYRKPELAALLKKYGDEHFAFRIAERIIRERKKQRIESTRRLAEIVTEALPYRLRFRKIHPATKVFMALRIAVNREIDNLEAGLTGIVPFLNKGARVCVIAFHSIEDRVVKNMFKELAGSKEIEIITKKPVRPDAAESESNPRSRSAKLRVGEKI